MCFEFSVRGSRRHFGFNSHANVADISRAYVRRTGYRCQYFTLHYSDFSKLAFLQIAEHRLSIFIPVYSVFIVQSLRGSPCAKNVREVSLHFHELDHVA